MKLRIIGMVPLLCLVSSAPPASRAEQPALRVPVSTAYCEPDPEALRIGRRALTGWSDAGEQLVWYGKFATPGRLGVELTLRLPALSRAKLALAVGKQMLQGEAKGAADGAPVTVDFGM